MGESERNVAARFAASPGLGCDTTGTSGATLGKRPRARQPGQELPRRPLPTAGRGPGDGEEGGGGGASTLDLVKPANPEREEGMGGRSSREQRDELWRWIKSAGAGIFRAPRGGDLGTGRAEHICQFQRRLTR